MARAPVPASRIRELSIADRWADDEGLVGLDADEDLLVPIFNKDGTVTSGAERAAARTPRSGRTDD